MLGTGLKETADLIPGGDDDAIMCARTFISLFLLDAREMTFSPWIFKQIVHWNNAEISQLTNRDNIVTTISMLTYTTVHKSGVSKIFFFLRN